jgi:proteasome accessory factor B
MSRIERLINLTAALLATDRPLTAEELAERVPGYPDDKASFRRQFERDKDALRELGMPIVLVMLEGAGFDAAAYRIDRDSYYVKDPGLTPDELSALTLAARLVRLDHAGPSIGVGAGPEGAMWKLRTEHVEQALEQSEHPNQARPNGELAADVSLPTDAALSTIFEAIAAGRSVVFTYRDESRHVVPRSLSFEKGRWYMSAFDIMRADDRSFRIDRMGTDVALGDTFEAPKRDESRQSPSLQRPWELGTNEPTLARVLVDVDQAPWAVRSVDEAAVIEHRDDGGVVIELRVRNVDAFRSFVLGFLESAEVLSPPALRADLMAWLQAMTKTEYGRTAAAHSRHGAVDCRARWSAGA